MKYYLIILFVLIEFQKVFAQEPIYIPVNALPEIMRNDIGYINWRLTQQDSVSRIAHGLHMQEQVKIISAFHDKEHQNPLAIHDAFYFNFSLGKMTSTPNISSFYTNGTEKKFSTLFDFGYLFAAGYKNNKWAAMAGGDFKVNRANVGGLTFPDLYGPLLYTSASFLFRGEICVSKKNLNYRPVIMVWTNLKKLSDPNIVSNNSLRIEVPFSKKGYFRFMVQYTLMTGRGAYEFDPRNTSLTRLDEFRMGIRVAALP